MIRRKIRVKNIKEKPILVASAVLFGLSFLARLYFAGQSAAANVELKGLFAQQQTLDQDISRLKYDDLRISSIAAVEEKAKQEGFVPMNSTLLSLDLTISSPIASR